MNNTGKHILILIIIFCAFSLSAQKGDVWSYKGGDKYVQVSDNKLDSIIENAKGFLNTKYVYGGCSKNGFDCSGFIYYVFNEFNIFLSKSSNGLSGVGQTIDFEDINTGDLLFFKSRNLNSDKVGHVSLVIGKTQHSFQMIHATNRGVVIDNYNEISYYQKRFLFAKRFISINETCHL
jgi:cell wall-associated NlpC family hydrolase